MKKTGILLGLIFVSAFVKAQDCNQSYYAKKGARMEMTEYDKEKQKKSVTVTTIEDVKLVNSGFTSKFRQVKSDAGGNVSEDKTCTFSCDANGQKLGLGVNDPKTNAELAALYPTIPETGKVILPDINYTIEKEEDGKKAKLSMIISNRKVTGTDKIKSPAGSFECLKLTYDLKIKLKLGIISLPLDVSVVEWYSREVGVVRTESWMKGKLEGYSLLTSVSK